MRILITGANGFIAREIIARLFQAGHEIIACVHQSILKNVPCSESFRIDYVNAVTEKQWLPHLKNIDVVINCVGVFQTVKEKTMWKIHYEAPRALFAACEKMQIKKIIHISALGVDKVDVPYAKSKLAAEKFLQSLPVDSSIIRPGLVYGKGSYGGTSLFRGLAGLPFVIPLPGKATDLQQPVHVDDLTFVIEKMLTTPGKQLLCVTGEEKLTVKDLLIRLRNWLGFKKALTLSIPTVFLNIAAKLGNFIPNSPLSETGMKMMAVDNVANQQQENELFQAVQKKLRGFNDGLNGMVSSVQDRWHARLYFLRPLLRLSIAFIWLYSGFVSLLPVNQAFNFALLNQAHLPANYDDLIIYSFSTIDILLGLATLFNFRLLLTGFLQCGLIVFYTLFISLFLPLYWLHPFAPIAKNIPLLIAILVMMAIASER